MDIFPCCNCNNGTEFYEEDNRQVYDTCYHCGGTGKVDAQTYEHDQLMHVAYTLAHIQEQEYRKNVNLDPDGEGYDFRAAENMMNPYDYFMERVYIRQDKLINELVSLPKSNQELLINWNNLH